MMRRLAIGLVMVTVLVAGVPAWADSHKTESSYWGDLGYGSVAVLCNLLYMPAKLTYGLLGMFGGGLGYVLTVGDFETADKIWSVSMGGTYVVTPGMLRGDEDFLVNGPTPDSK